MLTLLLFFNASYSLEINFHFDMSAFQDKPLSGFVMSCTFHMVRFFFHAFVM